MLEKLVFECLTCADIVHLHCRWSSLAVLTAATFVHCHSAMMDVTSPLSVMMGILFCALLLYHYCWHIMSLFYIGCLNQKTVKPQDIFC